MVLVLGCVIIRFDDGGYLIPGVAELGHGGDEFGDFLGVGTVEDVIGGDG